MKNQNLASENNGYWIGGTKFGVIVFGVIVFEKTLKPNNMLLEKEFNLFFLPAQAS